MTFSALPSVRESTSAPYERESIASSESSLDRDTITGLRFDPHQQQQRDTTILGGPSFAMQRLEPIKSVASGSDLGLARDYRASQDAIRALLARTTTALDTIVRIRESMEPFVDFTQFAAKQAPLRGSSVASATSTSSASHRHPAPPSLARLSSGPSVILQHDDHTRTTPASSYGSTAASSTSGSEDPLGRSTNSTHSSSSSAPSDDDDDESVDAPAPANASTQPVPVPAAGGFQTVDNVIDNTIANTIANTMDDTDDRESGNDTFDDSDDASSLSTLSSTADLTPLKELRLERLKSIEIAFCEGLPKPFFVVLTRFLFATLEVRTRHSRFNFYKDAFTGSDAVTALLVHGFCDDTTTAIRFGNVLVRLGFIEHVSRTDDQLHNSRDNFYRFTKAIEYAVGDSDSDDVVGASSPLGASQQSRQSMTAAAGTTSYSYRESVLSREAASGPIEYDFALASDDVVALVTDEVLAIVARVLLTVFERRNKLLFYKGFVGCFLGAEAVNVLRELGIAATLLDAVLVGQSLLDDGLVEPIATSVTTFQDKYVFYRLTKLRQ